MNSAATAQARSVLSRREARRLNRSDCDAQFSAFRDAYRHAAESVTERRSEIRLCGRPVALSCAGDKLSKCVGGAFAHLREELLVEAPSLTVELWDERATGVRQPTRGRPAYLAAERAINQVLRQSSDGRYFCHHQPHCVLWLDLHRGAIVGSFSDADEISLHERSKPLRILLWAWHQSRRIHTIHAGLVAQRGRGTLFVGSGGSGKSTSALACLSGGLDYLGDDLVGIQEDDRGSFVGHSLYGSAILWPDHALRFEQIAPHALEGKATTQKQVFLLNEIFPGRLQAAARLCAVIVPRVTGSEPTLIRPISKGRALLALAPSSMIALFPSPAPAVLETMGRLIERLPCFQLELGTDLAQVAPVIRGLLDSGASYE
jgi:hypothetical protein